MTNNFRGDIRSEVTPEIKANEILLQSQTDPRGFIIVEGKTDFRLFNSILDVGDWEVEYLNGKHNVVKCVNNMFNAGLRKMTAVLDRDPYDEINQVEPVVYSRNADLDSDMFALDGLIDRIIQRNSNIRDVPVLRELGFASWRQAVMSLVVPWTVLRDHASRNSIAFNFTDFPINEFADSSKCEINIPKFIATLLQRSQGKLRETEIVAALNAGVDSNVVSCVNGHHIAKAIAWIVSAILRSEKLKATTIEDLARMGIEKNELENLEVLTDLDEWAHDIGRCIWGIHELN